MKDIRLAEDIPALLEAVRDERLTHNFGVWRHRRKDGAIILVDVTTRPVPIWRLRTRTAARACS